MQSSKPITTMPNEKKESRQNVLPQLVSDEVCEEIWQTGIRESKEQFYQATTLSFKQLEERRSKTNYRQPVQQKVEF